MDITQQVQPFDVGSCAMRKFAEVFARDCMDYQIRRFKVVLFIVISVPSIQQYNILFEPYLNPKPKAEEKSTRLLKQLKRQASRHTLQSSLFCRQNQQVSLTSSKFYQYISKLIPMDESFTVEQQSSSNLPKFHPEPATPPLTRDLKNIIEVTEQHEGSPDQPSNKIVQNDLIPPPEKFQLRRYFKCCFNLYKYFCFQPQWAFEIQQKNFEYYMDKIRNSKQKLKPVIAPQKEKKRVLVLDLDETLICSTFVRPEKYDFETEIEDGGRTTNIYTRKQFGLEAFLFEMSLLYEIIIFTAANRGYADKVIDKIDPRGRVSHRLYRQHCIVVNKINYIKNVRILGRPLHDIVMVDDNVLGGVLQPDNFYRIKSFKGSEKDRQLIRLADFLKYLHTQEQMTPIAGLRKHFQEIEIDVREKDEKEAEGKVFLRNITNNRQAKDIGNRGEGGVKVKGKRQSKECKIDIENIDQLDYYPSNSATPFNIR